MTEPSNSAPRELQANGNKVVGGGRDDKNLSKSKKLKNTKSRIQTRIGATRKPIFLTSGTRKAFNQLKQVCIKAPIFWNFDPKCHIRIETNASGYTIEGVLSQLTSHHLTYN